MGLCAVLELKSSYKAGYAVLGASALATVGLGELALALSIAWLDCALTLIPSFSHDLSDAGRYGGMDRRRGGGGQGLGGEER